MKMEEIRWAFIGCGSVAEKKSGPAFNKIPGSRVVGVFRRDKEKARDYAYRHHIQRVYNDVDELLADPEVNAVYIATPHALHKPYALRVAEAGKVGYVEKPLGISYADAYEIVEAFRQRDLPLFVAYYRRRLQPFVWLKAFLESGWLGNITTGKLVFRRPVRDFEKNEALLPWRLKPELSGGGYFFDLAPHHLDFLSFVFPDIELVKAIHENRAGYYKAEDYTFARLILNQSVVFEAEWDFSPEDGETLDWIRFEGEKGWIQMPFFGPYPVRAEIDGREFYFRIEPSMHVQQPLLETIVGQLTGKNVQCLSTGETALAANRLMDEIVRKGPILNELELFLD